MYDSRLNWRWYICLIIGLVKWLRRRFPFRQPNRAFLSFNALLILIAMIIDSVAVLCVFFSGNRLNVFHEFRIAVLGNHQKFLEIWWKRGLINLNCEIDWTNGKIDRFRKQIKTYEIFYFFTTFRKKKTTTNNKNNKMKVCKTFVENEFAVRMAWLSERCICQSIAKRFSNFI